MLLTFVVSGCGREADRPNVSNRHPFVGERFTVSGDIGSDVARPVVLESFDEGWNPVADARTSSKGAYSFAVSTKSRSTRYRVVADATSKLEKHVSDPIMVTTVDDSVTLSVVRTGHDDGLAIGEAKLLREGRNFELQILDGKAWKKLGSDTEDKHGRTRIDFEMSKGAHFYRLVGDVIKGTQGATSPPMPFTKGPAKLGKNVTYVTVDQNKEPAIKGFDYKANAVLVADDEASKPFRVEEFEVRGNSTADKLKKPFKLKFKKSRRPFGLPDDKTWILLANFNDRTLIRTQLGYSIGAGLGGLKWTPRGKFTELYVNGDYQGSYQISESIKIDKNRIDIPKKKGVVIEIDPHFKEDHVPGFVGGHRIPYAFKDPDERKSGKDEEEGVTDAKVDAMTKRILDFEKVLYGPDFKDPQEGWTKYLDLDSAVDYYLVKEFTKENDGDFYRSNFFYTADYSDPSAKFFMGPVWDFDRSAGAKPDVSDSGTTIASPSGWWLRGHGSPNHKTDKTHWYVQLTKDPVFLETLMKRWAEKRAFFKDIADHGVDRMAEGVRTAADNDRAMTARLDDSIIEGKRLNARATTFAGEVDFLKHWYQQRFAWMDAKLR
jgi:hypothetical protein